MATVNEDCVNHVSQSFVFVAHQDNGYNHHWDLNSSVSEHSSSLLQQHEINHLTKVVYRYVLFILAINVTESQANIHNNPQEKKASPQLHLKKKYNSSRC